MFNQTVIVKIIALFIENTKNLALNYKFPKRIK